MPNILILFLIVICIDVSWSFQILSHLIRTQPTLSLSSSIKDDDINLSPSYQVNFDYEGRLRTLDPHYRCGFISLIGAANMGKSSLLNALLQETLCTTTHRPQTTRHAILGVLTSEPNKCQLCFYDTPGVIEDPAYKLQEGMMEAVKGAFRVSDVVLVVTDLFSTPIPDDELFNKLQLSNVKKIVCINKVDLVDKVGSVLNQQYHDDSNDEDSRRYKRTITVADAILNWRELVPDAVAIIPISTAAGSTDVGVTALRTLLLGGPDVPKSFRDLGRPLDGMFLPGISSISDEEASKLIPISPPLYAPETLTDKSERYGIQYFCYICFHFIDYDETFTSYTEGKRIRGFSRPRFLCVPKTDVPY